MAISVGAIVSRIQEVGLDAQPDTDYYSINNEIIPAIDSAQRWVLSIIQKARSENKQTDEIVSELAYCLIYITSAQSRILFDGSTNWWTIDAVAPLPVTVSNTIAPPNPPINANPLLSTPRPDLVFVSSKYSAYRKTIEQANESSDNPFSPGYQPENIDNSLLIAGSNLNVDFSYIAPYIYNTDPAVGTPVPYIEINPYISQKPVAVFLLKRPNTVTVVGDFLPFPGTMFNIIYEKALQFLSYSQGDGTTIWEVTEKDVAKLIMSAS